MAKLKDPADEIQQKKDETQLFEEADKLDIKNLKMADFKVVPKESARRILPFDGYPIVAPIRIAKIDEETVMVEKDVECQVPSLDDDGKPKFYSGGPNEGKPIMKKGTVIKKVAEKVPVYLEVSPTFIVGLNPHFQPPQDRAGLRVSITNDKTKKEEIKTLGTYHSRILRTGSDSNEDIVFDRVMEIEGRPLYYAVVKSHNLRAQLVYAWDGKRFKVDDRYLLLDTGQKSRLLQVANILIRPNVQAEKFADMVAGDSEATDESLNAIPTEA